MEVLEHIKDRKESIKWTVNFSGVNNFLSECYRILKKGGIMFLTTPNVLCYKNIFSLLDQKDPWLFFQHFKEYSKQWVCNTLENHGFIVTKVETLDVFGQAGVDIAHRIVWQGKFSEKDRGDDTFIIAKKLFYIK